MPKTLVIVTGPTGSGKTDLAIEIAESLDTEIVGADSRQIFRGLPIGTAAPSAAQLSRVKHHLVGVLELDEYYSAALFEQQALSILDTIWSERDIAVMCGGSMMYIDAVTNGIDLLPTISDKIRTETLSLYHREGLAGVIEMLRQLDPLSLETIDLKNHRRLIHALEITLEAGTPASQLRTGKRKLRPFNVVKLAVGYDRDTLFSRINARVDAMIAAGLEEEARAVYHLRGLNSLNTVGYKEMFALFDGTMDRPTAIARIAKNTRVYAKKQMLWLSKDPDVHILNPSLPLTGQALRIIGSGRFAQ